ncbi:Membrane protein, putative [Richelia intracellularis HH01]|uniref:Membrane protein, putative n=2 Tax=Richelia TaxID=98443 RepID=M1WXH7_9NOST|nr:Membrane protein, putative [Richelia intracellularis HH01]
MIITIYKMLDFWLVALLGFLGSFGHCAGMCGPLTIAFSLSYKQKTSSWQQQLQFNTPLNLGRILSYTIVGFGIGGIGSVLVASGQMAGVGSQLRQIMAIITGILLIWLGLAQIKPGFFPHLPILHPLIQTEVHSRLQSGMMQLSSANKWWTSTLLGMTWGLMPCGFLYTAQIKAAETGDLLMGGLTMLAFGLGTLPTMLGVSIFASFISKDRHSQLFRMGGWITLTIGILTLLRTGDTMVDYTGHGALLLLLTTLIARPISFLWKFPLRYRRALGVGAFILSMLHTAHTIEHSFQWNFAAFWFLNPSFKWGIVIGFCGLILMIPSAITSFNSLQKKLGKWWRRVHLLSLPAIVCTFIHTLIIGSHYFGSSRCTLENKIAITLLSIAIIIVFLLRWQRFWLFLSLEKFYVPPSKSN